MRFAVPRLRALVNIRRSELPLALLMFGFFFLVTTTYWVLKPIKKTVFVSQYADHPLHILGWSLGAAQAEQLAKVGNLLLAFAAVYFFTAFSRFARRQRLAYIFIGFCVACNLAFIVTVHHPGHVTAWMFYLYGDLFNTLMVAVFFAFLNDSFQPESARRTYGLVVLGGVVGGAVGSSVVGAAIDHVGMQVWLFVCLGLTVALAPMAWAAGRQADKQPVEVDDDPPTVKNVALAGARLVTRSRYLRDMVVIVFVYELISAILDFQFTSAVVHRAAAPDIKNVFAMVFMVTNIAALIIQVFLTSAVMRRMGMRFSLMVMPIAILLVSGGFFAVPTLFLGGALSSVDHSLNYSLNQSAREALYTPTTRSQKYAAKAFIDMFVQRFGKALAVIVNIVMTTVFVGYGGVRYLSLVVVALTCVWMIAAGHAGRWFMEITGSLPDRALRKRLPATEERVIGSP